MENNDLIIVTYFCPDLERQDILRNLVRQLSEVGKDILLAGHTVLPEDIVKSCKYHFYDKENKLLTGDEYKHKYFSRNDSFEIVSKDVITTSTHVLPVLRNLLFGLGIAKLTGYKYAHVVEYDSSLLDVGFFEKANSILEKDCASFWYDCDDNYDKIVGSYIGFNLNYFSYDEIKYNEEKILELFLKYNRVVESMVLNEFISTKPTHSRSINLKEKDGMKGNLYTSHPELIATIPFEHNNLLNIFIENKTKFKNYNTTIITDKEISKHESPPLGKWSVFSFGKYFFSEINYLKVISNNKVICEYFFDVKGERERFKQNNQISYF
jgi:hypothetical protein